MNDGLADVDRRVVGTKQVLRALDEGRVAHAYVAQDADLLLTKRVVDRCYDMDIPCTQVYTEGYYYKPRVDMEGARAASTSRLRPPVCSNKGESAAKHTGCYAARRRFVCYDPG